MRNTFEMHRANNTTIQSTMAAVVAGCIALACSAPEQTASRADSTNAADSASGTLLASADVGNGNVVEFRDVPGVGIVTITLGPVGAPKVDSALLEGKGVSDIYRSLTGRVPPQALLDAEKRAEAQVIGSAEGDGTAPPPAEEATTQERSGLNALEDQWSDRATSFTQWYCGTAGYDSVWCPLNAGGYAHSGWGAFQKAYVACGSPTDSGGTVWVDQWVNGAWQRQMTITQTPWHAGCIIRIGAGYYRSGIDSSTGVNAVDFSESFRYAIPTVSYGYGDFPGNRTYENFSEGLQGITHDQDYWYMSRVDYDGWPYCNTPQRGVLTRQPMASIQASPPAGYYDPTLIYVGYTHYGDLVQVDGYLYVGIDGPDAPGAVAVFNTSLQLVGYAALEGWVGDGWNNNPFMAYNKRDGLFYALQGVSTLRGYQITFNGNTPVPKLKRTVTLNNGAGSTYSVSNCVQGGKVSDNGNLYVSVGCSDSAFGIYAIDTVNGYVQWFFDGNKGSSSEFEGLDLWDLDADQRISDGRARGQIHLMKLNVDCGTGDDFWLSHFQVNDPSHL